MYNGIQISQLPATNLSIIMYPRTNLICYYIYQNHIAFLFTWQASPFYCYTPYKKSCDPILIHPTYFKPGSIHCNTSFNKPHHSIVVWQTSWSHCFPSYYKPHYTSPTSPLTNLISLWLYDNHHTSNVINPIKTLFIQLLFFQNPPSFHCYITNLMISLLYFLLKAHDSTPISPVT